MAVHNFKRSAFDRFERNERSRYSGVAKQEGVAVSETKISFGDFAGFRWLGKDKERTFGHYVLRNNRAFVYIELFRADSENVFQEAEEVLRSVTIQP